LLQVWSEFRDRVHNISSVNLTIIEQNPVTLTRVGK
jgi:hypothetical protein